MVEAAIKYITSSWWRTAPVSSLGQAQADLDRWAIAVSDQRKRPGGTIAMLAGEEALAGLPGTAFPAQLEVQRVVSRTAMVAFEGNRYSVPPGLVAQTVTVRARLGELQLEILCPAGRRVARHRRAPAGAGQILQSSEHARLLEAAVLDAFTTRSPAGESTTAHRARPPPWRPRGSPARARRADRSRAIRADREGRPVNKHATYQQLRGHLAYLKLTAAAEQLPAALEQAEKAKPGYTQFLTTCSPSRSRRPRNAASQGGCASPASPPPRRWRNSTSPPSPTSTGA